MARQPKWLELGDSLITPIINVAYSVLYERASTPSRDFDEAMIPVTALLHFGHCLETSMTVNKQGKHSIAITLLRHCIETLTLIDIGLQSPNFADSLLRAWADEKKSHGELRSTLEREIWHLYGHGLWQEPWAEFYRNLARAVQPYAHYTPALRQWQFANLSSTLEPDERKFLVRIGHSTYDPLKASRLTLLHVILIWTLGRLILESSSHVSIESLRADIITLGIELGQSKLLFRNEDWGKQLYGAMFFKHGTNWLDE